VALYDIREFIAAVQKIVAGHELGACGAYRRWNWPGTDQNRDLGLNPYGCAAAANILYTVGCFPRSLHERQMWVATLQGLQSPGSGFFHESTHHEIHTTAHCVAALELFDALPGHSLQGLYRYRDTTAMRHFLETLDWQQAPWSESHKGAGLYAAMVLAGEVSAEWEDHYFTWLWENTDPQTGFVRKGCVSPVGNPRSLFPHLAGTFHYLFNQEYACRPLRHPEKMVDTCLKLFGDRSFPLGKRVGFAEIDWVFCLTRSLRQCGHRYGDCQSALAKFAGEYVPFLLRLDPETDDGLNDLHLLFGALCCLAELQYALPGQIKTERPLRLVLDRRPFI
jgi:hypothetical protein